MSENIQIYCLKKVGIIQTEEEPSMFRSTSPIHRSKSLPPILSLQPSKTIPSQFDRFRSNKALQEFIKTGKITSDIKYSPSWNEFFRIGALESKFKELKLPEEYKFKDYPEFFVEDLIFDIGIGWVFYPSHKIYSYLVIRPAFWI